MKITTSVKLDADLKQQATELARDFGLSLSSVINLKLNQFVNERRISVSTHPQLNKKTTEEFLAIKQDIKERKHISGPYNNTEDLFKALKI